MNQHTSSRDRVRSVLEAAAAPAEPGELPGEAEALDTFRTLGTTGSGRSPMHPVTRLTKTKLAVAGAAGVGLLLAGGTAAAATGALPGAAQDTARSMLEKVGVTVPAGSAEGVADEETTQPDNHGAEVSELARTTEAEGRDRGEEISELASSNDEGEEPEGSTSGGSAEEGSAKGEQVSELATTTDSEGRDKGAEISGFASEGKAGGTAAESHAEQGGSKSEDGADGGSASQAGTAKADEASGGRSTAKSDNGR